jgi:hypothetical protein
MSENAISLVLPEILINRLNLIIQMLAKYRSQGRVVHRVQKGRSRILLRRKASDSLRVEDCCKRKQRVA